MVAVAVVVSVGAPGGAARAASIGAAEADASRIAGSDRYATAAAAADAFFPDGADVVVLVNGDRFADALVAAPAARVLHAPLLLAEQHDLPPATEAAISRLAPSSIVVVGGADALSAGLVERLAALAPDVERVAGADRFATAAAVSARWFAPGGPVYVVSGEAEADALATSAAAAYDVAPLLLTARDAIAPGTIDELVRLAPVELFVVGGSSIGEAARGVVRSLAPAGTRVQEIAGIDRYETAALLAAAAFPRPTLRTFVATGERFADAAVAAAVGGPVLLASTDLVADDALAQVERLAVGGDAFIVGGPGAVGATVLDAVLEATLFAVAPTFVQGAIPGIPTTLLVRAASREGGPLTLEVATSAGAATVAPATLLPGQVAEVSFVGQPVTGDETVVLTVTGARDGMTSARSREIVVMPGEDTVEPDARALLALFLAELGADHPELGLTQAMSATIAGSVVAPRLLVVSHYAFFDERWELGLAWHIMLAPDDWAELYLRPRGEMVPTLAFRIGSWSTALQAGSATVTAVEPPAEIVR